MKRVTAFAVLLIVLATSACTASNIALEAFKRRDFATAFREWRPLAEQGDAKAQHGLGYMYLNGWGVTRDYAEAVKWIRNAADQGYASAQGNLGVMYTVGQGVTRDYVQAHMWLNLAVAQGNKQAAKNRDGVVKRMTPTQIAEAQRLAAKWRPRR